METKTPPAPRIAHNSNLAAWFMVQHKVASRYPRVTEQIECLPLEHSKLMPHGYNPGMVEFDGKIYLGYRWHDGKTLHSSLAIAVIDEAGVVHNNHKIDMGQGGEDPKLFTHLDELCMSFVESNYPQMPMRATVQYGHFDGELLKGVTRPEVPGNDGSTVQKNHVPFSNYDLLYWLTHTAPVQQIYRLDGSAASNPITTPGPRWPYGEARGGTPPLPFEGNLLRFFHSGLDNEFAAPHRRYFLGAYLMRPTPPFEVLAVSDRPLVYGSEIDNVRVKDRPPHWKGNVVFPSGAIARDGYFFVSAGTNDSSCEILKILPDDLRLKLC